MPHVSIKHYPRDFTDEQKAQLSAAISTVILEHFAGSLEGSISIALEPVAEREWNATIVPDITGHSHLLIKAPTYIDDGRLGRT